jgi:outer membrane murein-binding lipoprotein Lpp
MRANLVRVFGGAVLALLVIVLLLPVAHSQQRRKRTSRHAAHPTRPQPVATPALPDEPSVVSSADELPATPRRTSSARQNTQAENEQLRGTVKDLSSQVEKLHGELNQMKTDQRAMYDLERLTRAEQFAENLRTQLRDVTDKEALYQERLSQIEYELQPDVIQLRAAGVGSLNPSAVRDSIQKSLERERDRINKQLELLASSRTHLEAAVASAEAQVEHLRQRVDSADQQQGGSADTTGNADTTGSANTNATPQPSPTPTPAQPPEE